jgi:hypothetical protein
MTVAGSPCPLLAGMANDPARPSLVMACREVTPRFMDRLLLEDEMPVYGGRASLRNVQRIRAALNELAKWLVLPVDKTENSGDCSNSVRNCA